MISKIKQIRTALSEGTAVPFRMWRFFLRRTKEFAAHHLSAYAAQMTFYLLLAVFPLLMLLCILTRLLPFSGETIQNALTMLLPDALSGLAVSVTEGYLNENISDMGIWLLLFLVWSCSRMILALMNAFNSIGGIAETRGQLHLRLIGCGYTLILCVMLVAMLGMAGLGSRLLAYAEVLSADLAFLSLLFGLIRNLISPLLLLLIFWCSYVFLPGRKQSFRSTFLGALFTALCWRGAASLCAAFLQHSMERYSYIYGSLSGPVLLLLWVYACMFCWLLGAELNRLWESCRPHS